VELSSRGSDTDLLAALVPLLALPVALDVYCLVDLARARSMGGAAKLAWAVVIVFVSAPSARCCTCSSAGTAGGAARLPRRHGTAGQTLAPPATPVTQAPAGRPWIRWTSRDARHGRRHARPPDRHLLQPHPGRRAADRRPGGHPARWPPALPGQHQGAHRHLPAAELAGPHRRRRRTRRRRHGRPAVGRPGSSRSEPTPSGSTPPASRPASAASPRSSPPAAPARSPASRPPPTSNRRSSP